MTKSQEYLEQCMRDILESLGEDINREGLQDTPKRFLKMLHEVTTPEEFNFTTFENEGTDEMIIVGPTNFNSTCEHHLAPFIGQAWVAYIPDERIVGISKLSRVVKYYATALQNQERITTQIADRLEKELKPKGVAVFLEASHTCMGCRGVRTPEAKTITTKLTGSFKENHETRNEFLQLVRRS